MKALIVGVGNPLKKDDNIGNLVARELSKKYETVIAETTPEAFINKMKEYDVVVFIDAIDFNSEPGKVKAFSLEQVIDKSLSTHSVPLQLIKSLLGEKEVIVVGIQPKEVGYGEELSKELKDVRIIARKAEMLLHEVLP